MLKRSYARALAAALGLAAAVLVLAACGGGDDSSDEAVLLPTPSEPAAAPEEPAHAEEPPTPEPAEEPPAEPPPPEPAEEPPPEPTEDPPASADTFTTVNGIECVRVTPDGPPDAPMFDEPPAPMLEDGVTYTATVQTNCGTIVMELDPEAAPTAANSFVFLARESFFDGLIFHRAVPGFVIQGGDPAGNGTGGPGYSFEDELPDTPYEIGDLAMANAGPDTNGSQFFIVTGDASQLPPSFSRFGRVTEGLDVAIGIESLGDVSQVPVERVVIESIEISES